MGKQSCEATLHQAHDVRHDDLARRGRAFFSPLRRISPSPCRFSSRVSVKFCFGEPRRGRKEDIEPCSFIKRTQDFIGDRLG